MRASYDLRTVTPDKLRRFSNDELAALGAQILPVAAADRKEMQLYYYRPASPYHEKLHTSTARKILAGGGNRSGKTAGLLAEMAVCATGIIPRSLRDLGIDWSKRLRGPINCRVVCANVTSILHPVILKHLRWTEWTGNDQQGGEKGHWGWIPKACLLNESWEKSWSEKYRTLRVLYRNPDAFDEILGESTIQFMSHEQDPDAMASADIHLALLDEPPPYAVYRETQARTMGVRGRILLAMTWPDDPSINVDWIFDQIYEPAQPGPGKDPDIDYFEIPSTANSNIDIEAVEKEYGRDELVKTTRLFGKPIRFSNRVHELFTDHAETFCFHCGRTVWTNDDGTCARCCGDNIVPFCHVRDFAFDPSWPVIWAVDPHPRKPHMSAYFACLPGDRLWQVAELECAQEPSVMRGMCDELEGRMSMSVRQRLMDPKMGGQPSGIKRERSWLDEFAAAGLRCDPADSSDVGRDIVNQLLRPCPRLREPRGIVHVRCTTSILQMKRFMWEDWKLGSDKDLKQKPKQKYDDYPALWRYVANSSPSFKSLVRGFHSVTAVNTRSQQSRAGALGRKAKLHNQRWGTYGYR